MRHPEPQWLAVVLVTLAAVTLALVLALVAVTQQRAHLIDEIRAACSETGAAAKLDLSSFVPLCARVK